MILLFGAQRLPEVVRAIGNAIREFKNALTDKDGEAKENPEKTQKMKRQVYGGRIRF
ncbi:MAG: twin-arginine translocase TatA/TatE family subunit [Chloroflexi bacterium]|nr:twin-arginine translocase TatA/TatE family subunit [Chloroflexota bacterium]